MYNINGWRNETFACKFDCLSNDDINFIMEYTKKTQILEDALIGDDALVGHYANLDQNIRKAKLTWLSLNDELYPIYEKITETINDINDTFFKYDLNHFEPFQFSEYNVSSFFKKHIDSGYDKYFSRKLSVSIQLTDENEYEGGDLRLYPYDFEHFETAPRKKGTAILFRSNLIHEITPIIKGKRNSLVSWIHGPRLK